MDWEKESMMFNRTSDYYDKYRPSYPREIIDTIIHKTGISIGSRLLEIGSGSGKATELFASKGYDILCIEPGPNLVEMGRKKFIDYRNVKFDIARFEDYDVEASAYDVVFSAQSFHWIPQPIGFQKCSEALKENGYLALYWNMYITYDNEIDNELVKLSNKYGGFADFLSECDCEKRISSIVSQIENSNLFLSPQVYRSLWKQTYSVDEYFGFILTGNRFVQKTEEEKERAYREIVKLADKNNGVIERPYLCVLYLAQKI